MSLLQKQNEIAQKDLELFVARIWQQGKELYRDLPWRNIEDPYQVLVSEIMLQQTQVKRVMHYWGQFLALFPTVDALAAADTALVLEQWQGLGYNRRALALKRSAEICAAEHLGAIPLSYEELVRLPGVGPATAAGVCAFAYNQPAIYLETNVRTVFIHEFFPDQESVKDIDIIPLVEQTCCKANPRAWYYALLDVGAQLKLETVNPSRKSAHYTKQSTFEGSRRQKRAEILRMVLGTSGVEAEELYGRMAEFERTAGRPPFEREEFDSIIADMCKERFFQTKEENGTTIILT